jgi:hypothetical protein
MPNPDVVLVHLEYIKARVDEHSEMLKDVLHTTAQQETRLAVLETATPKRTSSQWGAAGGFLGGLVAGAMAWLAK